MFAFSKGVQIQNERLRSLPQWLSFYRLSKKKKILIFFCNQNQIHEVIVHFWPSLMIVNSLAMALK